MADKIIAYALSEYTDRNGEQKTRWRRAGAAFENRDEEVRGEVGRDGGSINVVLDSIPLELFKTGELRLQLRRDKDDDDRDRGGRRDDRRTNDRRDDRRGGGRR